MVELREFEPRTFSFEGVSGPIGHRCMRCMSYELTARARRYDANPDQQIVDDDLDATFNRLIDAAQTP
jgi:hypothetical protein